MYLEELGEAVKGGEFEGFHIVVEKIQHFR